MCKFKEGEIVWGYVPYSDGTGVKIRPLIILKVQQGPHVECKYFIIECYSLLDKHYEGKKGIWIKRDHPKFSECGFKDDTFIHCKIKTWVWEKQLKPHPVYGDNPIGFCSFLDELNKYS